MRSPHRLGLVAAATATAIVLALPGLALADPSPGDPPGSGPATSQTVPSDQPSARPSHGPGAGQGGETPAQSRSAAAASQAPPGALFHTSVEAADPQPTWTSTAEEGKPAEGVTGRIGIPGTIVDQITEITASGENAGSGEVRQNLFDGDTNTKWLVFQPTGWVAVKLAKPIAVKKYAMASANDAPERDPRAWALEGSADGRTWTPVDTRTGQSWSARFETRLFDVARPQAFSHYRLNITANGSGGLIQLAELQLSDGDPNSQPPTPMSTLVDFGPGASWTAKFKAGFTGLKSLRYSGSTLSAQGGHAHNKVFETDVEVKADTELSYVIAPEFANGDLAYPSTYAALDLAFDDGTYLSDLKAKDQHGAEASARGQGVSKTLSVDQWNLKRVPLGKLALGKRIKRILLAVDIPAGPLSFSGYVDDITLGPARQETRTSPADYVLTTRGTHSSNGFSRGNNFPATAVPHGFNFWTPMTGSGSRSWVYEYHRNGNPDNVPTIQAFAASHMPSPWMGDRQSFQLMPSPLARPSAVREARALRFSHADEVAKAHYYSVTFANGIKTEMTPTDHAAVFRFTFPADSGSVIFDNINNDGGLTVSGNVVTGWTDSPSGYNAGDGRMFVYGVFDQTPTAGGKLTGAGRDNVTGYAAFAARTVELRLATSFITLDQAKLNLEQEAGPFDEVKAKAQRAWEDKLGIIQVEGASEDQLTTLYSNLYRLFLYPNSGFEKTPEGFRYASPVSPKTGQDTPTRAGSKIVDGKIYVNNGFWDTFRTAWPAYSLLAPNAGELVDGFVQQYRDGGWIARWSSPGYADLMPGTSSDVAFADAYVKGVRGFDAKAAYQAAVRNATVVPDLANYGRKGMRTAPFLGYTSTSELAKEGLSWALDGYLNDFGIANMATELAKTATGAEQARYQAEAEYFRNRALNYVKLFDSRVGFFQGRDGAGNFRLAPEQYDPRVWGFDYAETNGWNMAFHAPQDGAGLAALYGGRDKLAAKLDQFFATPETATFGGSYNGVIHEMREARDVRMGQYGHSNQPSHHIPYMYTYAGRPYKTQALVREVLRRLYLGSEIGQGYPGDEDNGEMSAWYLLSALGVYPLQVGSAEWAIGSPLFTKATVNLPNGKKLVVNAPGNTDATVYVQSLKVNGKAWTSTSIPHSVLAEGAVLDFTMGTEPSAWGTRPEDAPKSISTGLPAPLADVKVTGGPAALSDDTSATEAVFSGPVRLAVAGARQRVTHYTLTSGAQATDPPAWKLEGSLDGTTWTVIDERQGEVFDWRRQTRPFRIAQPGRYAHYRLTAASGNLAELELLAAPDPACTTTVTGTHRGPLTVGDGVTCLAAGATVSGPVTVRQGASLLATGATIGGPLTATGAAQVVLLDTGVGGPITATGTTGELTVEGSRSRGPVTLTGNRGPTVVAASTVGGPMTCTGNDPKPSDNGLPNTVGGPSTGQCRPA
ncbi:GH92 family glycosyl hydrolase [Nonomuraea sp. NPDC050328]|uniref:GH92 family glycosyl hydrolase n=1 Tax=Nonomuraea sp. NPDC050328 TaxID=3364361 RepID=UPI0037BA2226